MRKSICLAVCALSLVGAADTYYWAASSAQKEWADWGAAENWRKGTLDGAVATQVPGASDTIGYPQAQLWADLGGREWTIGTYDQDATPRVPTTYLGITNGTLTIQTAYEAYVARHYLYDGATLIIAPTVSNMYESKWSASYVEWQLYAGSRLDLLPQKINYFQGYYNVQAGATMRLAAKKYTVLGSPWPNIYRNWGTMIVTNGWDFTGNAATVNVDESTNKKYGNRTRDGNWAYMALDQLGGTMRLGGLFSNGGITDMPFYFSVGGGTLDVVDDTRFVGFNCTVSNDAQVVVNVANAAALDMQSFTFGENSVLTKTGAGTLALGSEQPTSLVVASGALELLSTELDLAQVTFAADSTLCFGTHGLRIDELPGYEAMHFSVDTSSLQSGIVFVRSSDAALLNHVQAEVQASLGSAYDMVQEDDGLLYVAHADSVFDATKGVGLDDPSGWIGGRVPAGDDVVIRGAGTVILDATSPAFRSIALELGARLETSGGTAAAPVVVPALTLNFQASFRVAPESQVVITNGITAYATASDLPVFEIATNGVAFVQDAAWPARGIYFKNLDVRLYGRLDVPTSSSDGAYLGSQMFFGYAEPGETSYMAFTADGGTIYAPHSAASYYGNRSLVSIASPAAGGRVKVKGEVLFRNYSKLNVLAANGLQGNVANSGYAIGLNNPVDEVFDVCVDNSNLSPAATTWFAGGSRTRFVNGGCCTRPSGNSNHSYGHTRGAWIQDAATVRFDGGQFQLDHACGNDSLGKGLSVRPATETPALTLGGGAKFTLWDQYGNGKATCLVTDGVFCVPRRNPPRMQRDAATGLWTFMASWTQTNTPAFNGFANVMVPAGGSLRFDAIAFNDLISCGERYTQGTPEEDNPYFANWYADWWEWHRKTALEVPVSGAGDVVVTNTLSGADPRNGAWYFTPPRTDFPDLSVWSMNLVLRGGANTCVGTLTAATNVNAFLHLADGANWAGCLKANAHVKFGDPIREEAGQAVQPAVVRVNDLALDGPLALRLWKDGAEQRNDFLEITGSSSATSRSAGLAGEGMYGYEPQPGEWFTVARCDKSAPAPRAARGWRVKTVADPEDDAKVLVCLSRGVSGTLIVLQ